MSATPTGFLTRRGAQDLLTWERAFEQPIDDVWAAVTDSDRLSRWIGTWTGDPTEGFVLFSMNAEGDKGSEPARYELPGCQAPRLLRVTSVSEWGSWVLALELAETDGTTTLTFTHLVDDVASIDNIGPGWEYYLDRLVVAESGGDAATVLWDDYYPAQREHYLGLAETLAPGIRERLDPAAGDPS